MTWASPEDEMLSVSAIEHYAYCPRQAALIHLEGAWTENRHTAEGATDHVVVDQGPRWELRDGVACWLSLPVWHDELRLSGICDIVEIHDGCPVPVEHKRILSPRSGSPAQQQLTAQALCLESMWGVPVEYGYLFSHRQRRRQLVNIDDRLRRQTLVTVAALRATVNQGVLPAPVRDSRCPPCSLIDTCLPFIDEPPLTGTRR